MINKHESRISRNATGDMTFAITFTGAINRMPTCNSTLRVQRRVKNTFLVDARIYSPRHVVPIVTYYCLCLLSVCKYNFAGRLATPRGKPVPSAAGLDLLRQRFHEGKKKGGPTFSEPFY